MATGTRPCSSRMGIHIDRYRPRRRPSRLPADARHRGRRVGCSCRRRVLGPRRRAFGRGVRGARGRGDGSREWLPALPAAAGHGGGPHAIMPAPPLLRIGQDWARVRVATRVRRGCGRPVGHRDPAMEAPGLDDLACSIRGIQREPRAARVRCPGVGDMEENTMSYEWMQRHCVPKREHFARPWSAGGRTYASIGHYLIAVPGEHALPSVAAPAGPHFDAVTTVPQRAPDGMVDLAHLVGRDMCRLCSTCRGSGRDPCVDCHGDKLHECSCGNSHECGSCDGKGSLPCSCDGEREEDHSQLCRVVGIAVDLAYLVRLAPHLRGPLQAWRMLDSAAVGLLAGDGVWAVIMERRDGSGGLPDVMEVTT